MMKYNVDDMLVRAHRGSYLEGADEQRIWEKAQRKVKKEKKKRWIPVVACVAVVVAVMLSVPTVRAAVADLLASVGEYMMMPAEERPAVEGVEVQQAVMGEAEYVMEREDGGWIDEVGVVINEAMFDGEKLYLNYTVDGSAAGLMGDPSSMADGLGPGETAQARALAGTMVMFENGVELHGAYEYDVDDQGGVVTVTGLFTGEDVGKVQGRQNAELRLNLADCIVFPAEHGSIGVDYDHAGTIVLPFELSMDAGRKTIQVDAEVLPEGRVDYTEDEIAENGWYATRRQIELSGLVVRIDRVVKKSTELVVEYSTDATGIEEVPEDLLLQFGIKAYLDGEEQHNADIEWAQVIHTLGGDGPTVGTEGEFIIPFPKKEAKELKLAPYYLYISEVDGVPAELDETVFIGEDANWETSETVLEEYVFMIPLD